MAEALYIDTKGFDTLMQRLKGAEKGIVTKVDEVLNANAQQIATNAKTNASRFKDLGGLESSIAPEISQPLKKHITVNANYAAYVEFGTGSYAAQYVSGLPADWQQFAARFHGKTGKKGLYEAIKKWVKSKGLHGLTKSG